MQPLSFATLTSKRNILSCKSYIKFILLFFTYYTFIFHETITTLKFQASIQKLARLLEMENKHWVAPLPPLTLPVNNDVT